MEKEIADIILRGELPILPPETFVTKEEENEKLEDENETLSKEKIRKIKRKQYFRRQGLKRQKEKAKLLAATPSFDFNAYTNYSFSRKDHDLHVKSSKETEDACDLDLEGKSNEELTQLSNNQLKQIENLEKENNRLRLAIYRIKKNLNTVSTM